MRLMKALGKELEYDVYRNQWHAGWCRLVVHTQEGRRPDVRGSLRRAWRLNLFRSRPLLDGDTVHRWADTRLGYAEHMSGLPIEN